METELNGSTSTGIGTEYAGRGSETRTSETEKTDENTRNLYDYRETGFGAMRECREGSNTRTTETKKDGVRNLSETCYKETESVRSSIYKEDN